MKRFIGSLAIALLLGTLATAASAQDGADYPGSGSQTVGGGEFTPGGSGSLTVNGLTPNTSYSGTIQSTPIPVSATSDANGAVTFTFEVPADFELGEQHTLTFSNGEQLAFCVGSSGSTVSCAALESASASAPTSASASDSLADTGARYVDDVVRIGLMAIAVGFALMLWHRRRVQA